MPANLVSLHVQEERLRGKALAFVADDLRLRLHIAAVEAAMDIADVFRRFPTNDEDLKVVQLLGMRTFNAFGAALKLALSGYHQNCALIMRDVLETVFLLDLFRGDVSLIERWRLADEKSRLKKFSPVKVREALDTRDGVTTKERFKMYKVFSELAGHPTMRSAWMLRPTKNGDAVSGPFIEAMPLEASVSEMGRLAVQVGEVLVGFFPGDWKQGLLTRRAFEEIENSWRTKFYPPAPKLRT